MGLQVRRLVVPVVAAGLLATTGCSIPRDPDHTLDRIDQEQALVAGAAPAPPLLVVAGGRVEGPEAELVEGFAATRGATVTWQVASQEELVKRLEDGQIDLMVGGLTSKSELSKKVGLTRAYSEEVDEHGDRVKYVVAAPLGENALVGELERWFDRGMPEASR